MMAELKWVNFTFLAWLLVVGAHAAHGQNSRQRSQIPQDIESQERLPASSGLSSQSSSQALASASSSASSALAGDQQSGENKNTLAASTPQMRRPNKPFQVAPIDDSFDQPSTGSNEDQQQPPPPPAKRRPRTRRPPRVEYDDRANRGQYGDEEGEDCYDDDYEYGNMFKPMRHFTRMMGSVFDQMQGMASGGLDFGNFAPGGGSVASASSINNGDGYSRTSSIVNRNGRTRGIISETRNGRTQTRRIGEDDNED